MLAPLSIIGGVVMVLALGAIFILSLAEASLLGVHAVTMRRLVEQGSRRANVIQELKSNEDYLSVIIVGINAGVIAVSTIMTVLVHRNLADGAHWQAQLWHIGAIVCILVLAEITPKTWGALAPEKPALALAPTIRRLIIIAAPAVRVLTGISNIVLRATGGATTHRRHFVTTSEIQAAADIGEEEGMVEHEEGEMLDSVIELGDTTAKELIVPRVDIVAVPADATVQDFVEVAVDSGHSRIPVFEDTIDSIVGVLYVTDVLTELAAGRRELDLGALARPPVFVPETKRVSELFRELRDASVHIAVVLDEFGGTEGLVTIEDILEELVGDIEDEHDAPAADELLIISDAEALVNGKTRIEDVNEQMVLELPSDEYETIGGLVAGEVGHIPQTGEQVLIAGAQLTVEQGSEQLVERVRIVKSSDQGARSGGP